MKSNIGADERLVQYAVRRRFPELPGEKVDVGQDYLEKLVQYPVRVDYLRDVLDRIAACPVSQLDDLLPRNWKPLASVPVNTPA